MNIKRKFFCTGLCTIFALLIITKNYAQQSNTMLWRIEAPNSKDASYLYGTMHVALKKHSFFYDSVYQAIQQTNSFYGELDYFNMNIMNVPENYYEKKLAYLDSIAATPNWKKMIQKYNEAYGTTISYDNKEEFIEATSKQSNQVYEREAGAEVIDIALAKFAKKLRKKTGGLETFMQQMDMLYKIIAERMNDSIFDFTNDDKMNLMLKELYFKQEGDSLGQFIDQLNISYLKILFDDRNITMADSIQKIMQQQTTFVAVGAGHLFGSKGILKILQSKNYTVTPVFGKHKIYIDLMSALVDATANAKKTIGLVDEVRIVEDLPPPPPLPQPTKKKG